MLWPSRRKAKANHESAKKRKHEKETLNEADENARSLNFVLSYFRDFVIQFGFWQSPF